MTTVTIIDQLDSSQTEFNVLEKIDSIKEFLKFLGFKFSKTGKYYYKDYFIVTIEEVEE